MRTRGCRAVVIALLVAGVAGRVAAGSAAILEDWSQRMGHRGVPAGWLELPLLERALVRRGPLRIVDDEGHRALRLMTNRSQHTIIRKRIALDLNATPILEWQWKIVALPAGADLRDRARSDSPAVLALAWRQPPHLVAYAWDVTEPVGSRFDNPRQPRVHYIVVRSGSADRGRWLTERRDIVADYRTVFGEAPSVGPEEMEISIDSNNTQSSAETLIGAIRAIPR